MEARELARRSYRLTATNVSLALGFNGIGVLAAITGMVAPVWAMLAMAVSVSVVLANSFAVQLGAAVVALPLLRAETPQRSQTRPQG